MNLVSIGADSEQNQYFYGIKIDIRLKFIYSYLFSLSIN
jgi:hypothetical protein